MRGLAGGRRDARRGRSDSSPIVANGVVYVGSGNGNVYALDAAAREEKWAYQTRYSIDTSPAVADGMVYGSIEDTLYAFHFPGT
jgi:eukaryotic-like serine/threonine-protein kinase